MSGIRFVSNGIVKRPQASFRGSANARVSRDQSLVPMESPLLMTGGSRRTVNDDLSIALSGLGGKAHV